ncbi:MAG: tRNA (N(6)-L-threonylcarbamoyladenosine(37)-C(2))-methylthiotransferase MtaB, partial [Clostridia bacterium]|nr:tRNA (N(6)-L-threonylcarbamoyladenosine(37)-C(2))-methylthiotransferase MtaB [Clostridia bacterium]
IKRERAAALTEAGKEIADKFLKSQIGTKHSVLFEKYDGIYNYGHTKNFIYVKVVNINSLENMICDVIIKDIDGEECSGVLCSEN